MKRNIVLAVAGLLITTGSVYGSGSIAFNTYLSNNSSGIEVTYANGPQVGQGIGNAFTGQLLYSFTPITDSATSGLFTPPLTPGWTVGSTGTFGTGGVPAGYVAGPNLNLSAYTSGPVYFEIVAFNGSSYNTSILRGHSASFYQDMATGTTIPWPADGNWWPSQGNGSGIVAPFAIYIPEPTTTALGGLGLASLLLFRRKQA
jgi:hypothetical protein